MSASLFSILSTCVYLPFSHYRFSHSLILLPFFQWILRDGTGMVGRIVSLFYVCLSACLYVSFSLAFCLTFSLSLSVSLSVSLTPHTLSLFFSFSGLFVMVQVWVGQPLLSVSLFSICLLACISL